MIRFKVSKEIENPNVLWEVVKDVSSIPNYWKGIRELRVKEISPGIYEGEVKFAFPSTSKVRLEIRENERKLLFHFLGGILKGFNEVRVGERTIESTWEVEMPLYMRPLESRNQEHFRQGTENALERMINEAKTRTQG
jgi:hypothetical protein